MRNWWARLFASKRRPLPLSVEEPDAWGVEQASRLAWFLSTPEGQNLMAQLYYTLYCSALIMREKTIFEQGKEVGRAELVSLISALADVSCYRDEDAADS